LIHMLEDGLLHYDKQALSSAAMVTVCECESGIV
jgi:hypothetical protein